MSTEGYLPTSYDDSRKALTSTYYGNMILSRATGNRAKNKTQNNACGWGG
jgi:hypothetical protein